jgi:hypothetical protein
MAHSAASETPSKPPSSAPSNSAEEAEGGSELSTAELLERLRQDRLWLLRQIDSGRWTQWRLDLAALERELGQLLEQAAERCGEG